MISDGQWQRGLKSTDPLFALLYTHLSSIKPSPFDPHWLRIVRNATVTVTDADRFAYTAHATTPLSFSSPSSLTHPLHLSDLPSPNPHPFYSPFPNPILNHTRPWPHVVVSAVVSPLLHPPPPPGVHIPLPPLSPPP